MTRLVSSAGFLFLVVSMAIAQPAPSSAFEVASVKLHDGRTNVLCGVSSSGPRLDLLACSVYGLVREAYDVKVYQVSFAASVPQPDPNVYYDISAKAEGDGPRTRSEFHQMLQKLLAERFQLTVHRESREMQVYTLVLDRGGPKFKESAPDAVRSCFGGVNGRNQYTKCTNSGMEDLAFDIWNSLFVDRPVLDKTGLKGLYDFRIEATPQFRIESSSELTDISVFTAVEEQLGLKLTPAKQKVDILVVDRWEKPSAN